MTADLLARIASVGAIDSDRLAEIDSRIRNAPSFEEKEKAVWEFVALVEEMAAGMRSALEAIKADPAFRTRAQRRNVDRLARKYVAKADAMASRVRMRAARMIAGARNQVDGIEDSLQDLLAEAFSEDAA